eukprot:CAMPEP_0201569496 /NCGR_PEP_ID=MMETSP0190_2-20130828/11198_1 /ASSEMBLY_ACC=CAM_ASM_000263 /TAXON_ID=37353 /ORGANISM="Rosalina sp." /LENGTH=74 /DNA_ID=CAMNT_0047991859 /DNA_START=16 /DNA_END=237 /DNA_ORIENTATION=+
MAQLFQDDSMLVELEDGFKELIKTVVKNMNALKTVETKGIRDMIDQIKSDLKECGTTIKEMKMELKALDNKTNW